MRLSPITVERLALFAMLTLAGCSDPKSPASSKGPAAPVPVYIRIFRPLTGVLTPQGLGPIRIGMSEADAIAAMDGLAPHSGDADTATCHLLHPKAGPSNLYAMAVGGKIVRISVWDDAPGITTDKGVGLGATEAQVRAAYGPGLDVEPADYDEPPAVNLIAWAVKGKSGIRYATDQLQHVHAIHAGDASILYMEDCE